jgi:predicted nucleotidyltransferase
MAEYFRSAEEARDLVDLVRRVKKKGACRVVVHGSMVGGKGPAHRDVDVYIEYPADRAHEIGCYGLGDLDFIRVERGPRSNEPFDVRESNAPFERSSLGDEYNEEVKPKRIVFGSLKRRDDWE